MRKRVNEESWNATVRRGWMKAINIGNPYEITILELAQKIRELAGSSSSIVHKPLPPDDPKRRCPDITKAKNTLGWAPTVFLQPRRA
jgi:UDP-glucuronate decarboxylase